MELFDLAGMETRTLSQNGADMTVQNMAGDPLKNSKGEAVLLTLLGPDSDTYREKTRAQVRARIARQSAGETADFATEETEILDVLVACVVGWKGLLDKDGKPVPFTPEAARTLLVQYPLIRDQVDLFIARRGNFILASSAA
jgi:hypothetical protein